MKSFCRSWSKWLGRVKSGLPYLGCCPMTWPRIRGGKWINGRMKWDFKKFKASSKTRPYSRIFNKRARPHWLIFSRETKSEWNNIIRCLLRETLRHKELRQAYVDVRTILTAVNYTQPCFPDNMLTDFCSLFSENTGNGCSSNPTSVRI